MRNLPILHRTRLHRAVTGSAALALGAVLTLSACSSGSDDGDKKDDRVASLGDQNGKDPSTSPEAAAGDKGDMVKYASCMREHGVDMPDPAGPGSTMAGQAIPAPGSADEAKLNDASAACRKWLPNGGEVSEKDKAEQREKQLKEAQCLREHGLDVPDPGPDGGLAIPLGDDLPKANAALQACGGEGGGPAAGK
ncbi:MAG: hypothetical protein HOV68_27890 [Streptomycetaceae bacterium]|nr:hypothetical protein [Streptomycetaceae bacterium]